MNTVTLTRDGEILEGGRPVGDALAALSCRVQLEPGYTLRGFFRLLETQADLARLSAFVPALMARFRNCPESGCACPGLDTLQLSKTVEMIGFPGRPRLEIYMSFQGIAEGAAGEIKFVPLESLVDMPVSLGPLKHIVFGDKMDVFTFQTVYTLFEVIDGILWELSFHGTPAQCIIRR